MKLNLNLLILINPEQVNHDTIKATLPGAVPREIIIQRRLCGWQPQLNLTVDGVRVHSSEATPEDRSQFSLLAEKISLQKFRDDEQKREQVLAAVKAAQLW